MLARFSQHMKSLVHSNLISLCLIIECIRKLTEYYWRRRMKDESGKFMDENTKKLSFVVLFLGIAVMMLFSLAG